MENKKFKDTGCRGKKVKHEQRKYNDHIVSILEVQGLTENQELDFSSKDSFSPTKPLWFSVQEPNPPLPPPNPTQTSGFCPDLE